MEFCELSFWLATVTDVICAASPAGEIEGNLLNGLRR
jgi:hypothetical protein